MIFSLKPMIMLKNDFGEREKEREREGERGERERKRERERHTGRESTMSNSHMPIVNQLHTYSQTH